MQGLFPHYYLLISALTVLITLSRLQNLVFVPLDPLDPQDERSVTDTSYFMHHFYAPLRDFAR